MRNINEDTEKNNNKIPAFCFDKFSAKSILDYALKLQTLLTDREYATYKKQEFLQNRIDVCYSAFRRMQWVDLKNVNHLNTLQILNLYGLFTEMTKQKKLLEVIEEIRQIRF